MPLKQSSLIDIQPLFGGQNLFLNSNGDIIAEIVRMREKIKCKRYKFNVPKSKINEFKDLLNEHNFPKIDIPERAGVPDEARPKIKIILNDGSKWTKSKWANDKHEDFDKIYGWMLNIINEAEEKYEPFYKGSFEYNWRPEGF